jgi:transposase
MTNAQMIRTENNTKNDRMYIALELSNKTWKLLFSNGFKKRQKTIDAGKLYQLEHEIAKTRKHFGMSEDVKINSCYEAGRDGFWIHRFLESRGIHNIVVDSASIEVNRRSRRAKTDRIDADKLLNMLMRYIGGERKLWSVLHVPSSNEEDARRINREIKRLKKERTAHTNRIKSLLILHGIRLVINRKFLINLEQVRLWNGEKLPRRVKAEIVRDYQRYELIKVQLLELELDKNALLKSENTQARKVVALKRLKGIGTISSWDLVYEFFGWRRFNNVKQVGGAAGLAPTPYASGSSDHEQGISKAGNRRVRSLMIELAWYWLRFQPQSKLSCWFQERFGSGGKRMRKIGIVALARKLLVSLWKYLDKGVLPEGAQMKAVI